MKTILLGEAASDSGSFGFSDACPLVAIDQPHAVLAKRSGTGCYDLPAGPDGVDIHALGNVDNQLDVGVIVVVGAAGDLDVVVGHANIVGIGLEVLGSGHDGEVDGLFVAKRLVRPFPDGTDLLDGGNSVVCDENLFGHGTF